MAGPVDGHDVHRQRGQATVELVLVLPVVLLALLLVVQVAVVARAHLVVVHAARDGARAAAVEGTADAARAAISRTPGLPAGCSIEAAIDADAGATATVSVRCRVATDVALVGPLLGSPTVGAESTMLVEGPALGVDGPGG